MGWYHAKQLLDGDCPSAKLTDVVEPWFLGGGKGGPGYDEFAKFQAEASKQGVAFHENISDMPKPDAAKLAMICTRTADMPRFVDEAIGQGCSHIFLEKPGAPTVAELETMASDADKAGVPIYMGYNKNVTKYVTLGREALAAAGPDAEFTLVHHNAYTQDELAECFERNAEGILKNMAIHELALLVTFFGVNAETVESIVAHRDYSSCLTLKGPSSGKDFTDFPRVGFTIKTKAGATVSVKADRTGLDMPGGAMADGAMMYAMVTKNEVIQARSIMPDAELLAVVDDRTKAAPDFMPYFHLQHDDYITLKERVCSHIATKASGSPEGIATIQIGVDTLKLAEMLVPTIQAQLA